MHLTDPEGLAKDFPHQPNYEALCKSVQNGCHICVFLRLIIDRGLPGDLMRYAVDPEEALLPIKLSQTSTDWYSIHTAGICISVGVPCHPTCKAVGAGPKPRVITTQLDHRCFKPPLLQTHEETFTMLNKWLGYCQENHPKCSKGALQPLPTRVIDVKDDGSVPSLLLTDGQRGQYLALSHCWGSSPSLLTTTANIQKHLVQISIAELPRNFQDAVTVTRRLGFRYLWIDSLCIIQDSELDWAQESAQMGAFYSNAFCTIAASSAASGSCGFLLPKSRLEITGYEWISQPSSLPAGSPLQWHINSPTALTYESPDVFEKGIRSMPLNRRAWVLQERILSSRIIHFVQNQVLWECTTHAATEFDYIQAKTLNGTSLGLTRSEDHYDITKAISRSSSHFEWYNILMDYTSRGLTYRRDRLPAIWALAQDVQIRLGGTYVAGLFKEDLIYGMLFHRTVASPKSTNLSDDAPSWSWASLEAPAEWTALTCKLEPVAQLTDLQVVEKSSQRPMGRTLRAAATLSACMGSAMSVPPDAVDFRAATPSQRAIIDIDDDILEGAVGWLSFDHDLEDFEKANNKETLCIQLAHQLPRGLRAFGIVVIPTGHAENEYRRVGYYERFFDYYKPGTRLVDTAERQTLVII
ncbi:Heterokaryon incompatibility protein (HET) domain containing protein [Elaphomyces granulatus]